MEDLFISQSRKGGRKNLGVRTSEEGERIRREKRREDIREE